MGPEFKHHHEKKKEEEKKKEKCKLYLSLNAVPIFVLK
jgi:hypothetical protein